MLSLLYVHVLVNVVLTYILCASAFILTDCLEFFILVDDSGEHQIGDDGGNTVEEFASDDVQSPPEGDKTKLSLNEELGQLGVLNPPTPLSPDSKDSNASQKGK